MKRAFEVKEKTYFLVSQVLSVRHTNQISKNVADTTFKDNLREAASDDFIIFQLHDAVIVNPYYPNLSFFIKN